MGRAAGGKLLERKKKEEREKSHCFGLGLGHCLGPWFRLENGGGKWAQLGWNWAYAKGNGLGRCHG